MSEPLVFKPTDAATAEAVRKFTSVSPPPVEPVAPAAPPAEEQQLSFGAATEFDEPNQAMLMSSGMVDMRLAGAISDEEKFEYLKQMLNDQPFQLEVKLFGGKFSVTVKTRTLAEQQRINDLIYAEFDEGRNDRISAHEVALCSKRTNQYLIILMVRQICGVSLDAPDLLKGSVAEAKVAAAEFAAAKLEPMNVTKMTAITNVIRIFESKSARLATEAANESFWQPRS